ncbi:UV DNA damage repair endonuclease UvsE [Paenibacillus sp. CAA11]|uniref:UV DNA damage repair endonuclease UvsE n=1 Tax=Paenibacillus sp. CAA11 TaxID=1532905 RepID=UPI000D366474|nr:UV DNA damage repair endonuclease UvsE [Paenibacillus sp. CAA11]AWB43361.1 UV DNA damage repair endonuclease UvsE [Paenibacillus sp. CAA11]
MKVRFGYVAMSTSEVMKGVSPSKTMTMKSFQKIADRPAAIRKLEHIAAENLHNTLRLLKHNTYNDIKVYRLTSKLIPLATHQDLADWDPFAVLQSAFREVGDYANTHGMRLSFHPDHFTVLSTPRPEVLKSSVRDLSYHMRMLDAMGLNARAKNNIHVGGSYGDKQAAGERFVDAVTSLPESYKQRLTFENDDKTFTAVETLELCERLAIPMVLDIHHHWVNNDGERPDELWSRVLDTWRTPYAQADSPSDDPLPPKIHASSPKGASDPRSHADGVEAGPLLEFLRRIASYTDAVDVMIEAKLKDGALFGLMDELKRYEEDGVKVLDGATVEITP